MSLTARDVAEDAPGRAAVVARPRSARGRDASAQPFPIRPRFVAGIFAVSTVYAVLLAVVSHGAEAVWGEWAAGGYAIAAVTAWTLRRRQVLALVPALTGAFAVPVSVLRYGSGATDEVRVVARAATLWLAHGTPYLASGELTTWRSYDPYLPGMSFFGLPDALGVRGLFGSPVTWLAVVTVALFAAAFAIAARSDDRSHGSRRSALVPVTVLVVASPVLALPMSLGVTDPPVIALVCLGLALAMRTPADLHHRSSVVLAGVAVGVACSLKATAWPALPVLLALFAARDGRRAATRFAVTSIGAFLVLVAATAPALFTNPGAFWQNIVAYPLGLSRRSTPAGSPLLGHLLASLGWLGHVAAIAALAVAALALAGSLVVRPPRDVGSAVLRLTLGLLAMIVLAPATRFGYFAYPIAIFGWWVLSVPDALKRRPRSSRQPAPAESIPVPDGAAGIAPARR